MRAISKLVSMFMIFSSAGCQLDNHAEEPKPIETPRVEAPTTETPTPPKETPTQPAPPKKEGPTLTLSWSSNSSASGYVTLKRDLTADQNHYRAETAFTVPRYAPSELEVIVDGIPKSKESNWKITAQVSPKSPYDQGNLRVNSWSIQTNETKPGMMKVRSTFSGLNGLVGKVPVTEEVLNVSIQFAQDSGYQFTVDFVVMTPPYNVIVSQQSLAEYESASHTLSDDLKFLESTKYKLVLIQVIDLQNLSNRTVTIDFGKFRNSKFSQRSVWIDPQGGPKEKDL